MRNKSTGILTTIELEIAKRRLTQVQISNEMGITPVQLRKKIRNYNLLRFKDINYFLEKFKMTYEELFKEDETD